MPVLGHLTIAAVVAGALLLTSAGADAQPPHGARIAAKGAKKPVAKPKPAPPSAPAKPGAPPSAKPGAPPSAKPGAHAKPGAPAKPTGDVATIPPLEMDVPIAVRHLAGGVLAVVAPAPNAPIVTVTVVEGAGASSDPKGRGGLASLRARAGGSRATAEQRMSLVATRGGATSIEVGSETISSRYVLPAGELALPLWLEHDRLDARLTEESLVSSLRAMAEARERDPRVRFRSALDALLFSGLPARAHDPDGTADELLAIRNDAIAGTLSPRPPRPVVIVVTGAADPESTLKAIDEELGGVEARPTTIGESPVPDQTNQREAVVHDARAGTGSLWIGFAIPPASGGDHPALEVAAALLAGAPRSRLERSLMDEGIARAVRAELEAGRGPSELRIEVELAAGADPVRAREITERALLELGKSAPPPEEVRRSIAWLVAERVRRHADPAELGAAIAAAALRDPHVFDAPRGAFDADLDRWNATTGDAVARAAAKHLSPIRRNVLEVKPDHPLAPPAGTGSAPSGRRRGPAAAPPAHAAKPPGKKPGADPKKPSAPKTDDKSADPKASKPPHDGRPGKKRGKP